eukprot:3193705-Pyramimonas_sp.AAC.1
MHSTPEGPFFPPPGRRSDDQVKTAGFGVLYAGALANFTASWAGNYPWFVVFNYLQETVPAATGVEKLVRNAGIGFCASAVSDTVSTTLMIDMFYRD